MKKTRKSLLSILLAVILVIGLFPAAAFAKSEAVAEPAAEEQLTEAEVTEAAAEEAEITAEEQEATEDEAAADIPAAQDEAAADIPAAEAEETAGDGSSAEAEEAAEPEGTADTEEAAEPVEEASETAESEKTEEAAEPADAEETAEDESSVKTREAADAEQPAASGENALTEDTQTGEASDSAEVFPEADKAEEDPDSEKKAVTEEEPSALAGSGTCGDNLTWTLSDDGVLTISGTGKMTDFSTGTGRPPWYDDRDSITSAVIGEGVTSIGHMAFDSCTKMTSVSIPNGVTSIGNQAFYNTSLTTVTIPNTVTNIYKSAFSGTKLTGLTIPASVTSIGPGAFANCGSLPAVTVASGNKAYTAVDGVLFTADKKTLHTYPKGKSDSSYTIPKSVTIIGGSAFYSCRNLTDVVIPDSVKSIEDFAFYLCAMTSITIPASVTNIGNAFRECRSLTDITFKGDAPGIGSAAFYNVTATAHYLPLAGWTEAVRQNYGGTLTWVCDNKCGDDVTWKLSGDGVLTISGTGDMLYYPMLDLQPWYWVSDRVTSVVIENGVTNVGGGSFNACGKITSVTIPDTVTTIEDCAFANCGGLTDVMIPNSVTDIGDSAFFSSGLKSITIPSSVTSIERQAFKWSKGLKEITFEGNAPSFGTDIFYDVTATAYYPAGDPTWTASVRQDYGGTITWANGTCGDSLIWDLTDGVLTISGTGDMYDYSYDSPTPWYDLRYSIVTAVVKSGVTGIGNRAFFNCSAMTSVSLPDGLKTIGRSGFYGCSGLTSVTIPASLTSFKEVAWTFIDCTDLTAITVEPDNEYYCSKDGVLFNKDKTELLHFPAAKSGSYEVPSSVKKIGDHAFGYNCKSLTAISLPEGLTQIGNEAFYDCDGLAALEIPSTVTKLGLRAFADIAALKEIRFKGNRPGMTMSSTSDTDSVFRNVTATVYYPPLDSWNTTPSYFGKYLTWVCDNKCGDDVTWKLSGDGVLTISGTGDMWDYMASIDKPWYSIRSSITSLVIESGVTGIGNYMFSGCYKITDVSIPTTVTTIGDYAFSSCGALTSVNIPDGVTSIGGIGAFSSCDSLTEVIIGNSVTSIGVNAFRGCAMLTDIRIPDSVTSIGNYAFRECFKLENVTIGSSVTSIGYYAFADCNALSSITIPPSVTSIEYRVFNQCSSLTSITFEGSAPILGENLFGKVTATAYYPAGDPTWTESVRQNYGGTITWVGVIPLPEITSVGMSTEGVALTWKKVPGATKYEISRTAEAGAGSVFTTVTETSHTDDTALSGETYTYKVRAYANGDWTDYGEEKTVAFNPFTDVPSTGKTFEYVSWAFNNGIVTGSSNTTFSPNNSCTRVQFVMMLWKMNGSPTVKGKNPFSDITDGTRTCKAILWALDAGVINSGTTFNPNGNISRVQIVMMLWKMAGSPEVTGKNPFTDVSGGKTVKAVLWAFQNGITKGTSDTTFSPNKDCTRLQLVIFLFKYNGVMHII